MCKNVRLLAVMILLVLFGSASPLCAQRTIVEKYGQLSVDGNYIIGEHGDTVQLRGMSLFWSQWMPQFYNRDAVKWLRDDWRSTVVRAAMGVEKGGYLDNPEEEKQKVIDVVDAAIDLGIYVIIDYHSHEAHTDHESAKKFFAEMAERYHKYPNVIYEIYNEPLQDASWSNDIKPYAEAVISTIRKYDSNNLIIVGTRQWSQMVSEAAADPIDGENIVYTVHYYAATHGKWLINETKKALDKGIAVFVSEYGITTASGDGRIDYKRAQEWYDFLDERKISWCNWSIADKEETSAALKPGASGKGGWKESELTESGTFVRNELIKKNTPIFKSIKKK
ncbi:glycoside hydrolase family 5 protein [Cytophagaceae bacterium ABcell3]|nr:glycoside hydrolase family 5 protein [Cytophagaceae bacterium ABcell3]